MGSVRELNEDATRCSLFPRPLSLVFVHGLRFRCPELIMSMTMMMTMMMMIMGGRFAGADEEGMMIIRQSRHELRMIRRRCSGLTVTSRRRHTTMTAMTRMWELE